VAIVVVVCTFDQARKQFKISLEGRIPRHSIGRRIARAPNAMRSSLSSEP
jgi:hypothetical protein